MLLIYYFHSSDLLVLKSHTLKETYQGRITRIGAVFLTKSHGTFAFIIFRFCAIHFTVDKSRVWLRYILFIQIQASYWVQAIQFNHGQWTYIIFSINIWPLNIGWFVWVLSSRSFVFTILEVLLSKMPSERRYSEITPQSFLNLIQPSPE